MTASINFLLLASRQEGLDAVCELLARRLRLLQVRLELQRVLEPRLQRVVHRALGRGHRLPWLVRELAGEVPYFLLELVGRDDPVDDSQPVRVGVRQLL